MAEIKSYKDLLIWQKGIQIVKEIYLMCHDLPKVEEYGLQSQIKGLRFQSHPILQKVMDVITHRIIFNY